MDITLTIRIPDGHFARVNAHLLMEGVDKGARKSLLAVFGDKISGFNYPCGEQEDDRKVLRRTLEIRLATGDNH